VSSILNQIAATVSQACQLASVSYVALGALGAVTWSVWRWRDFGDLGLKKAIWRRFAANVVLALEFALGADIVDTAFAPTWQAIGQLAAIAAIRTALNFFLARDLDEERGWSKRGPPATAA
jgi:uncharacterized membrane protein